jgi:hypothetical protein
MKKNQLRLLRLLTALATLIMACALPSQAQYTSSSGYSFNNMGSAMWSSAFSGNAQMQFTMNMQRMLAQSTQRRARQAARTPNQPVARETAAPLSQATTIFAPSERSLMPRQLAASMGKTPTQRKQLEQLFGFFLKLYTEDEATLRSAASQKASGNDVARGIAYFIVGNHYVSSDGDKPTPEQYEDLCERVRDYLLGNEQFQALGNKKKQEIHEALAIMAVLPQFTYEESKKKNDPAEKAQAITLAIQNLAHLGIRAEGISLTPSGILIK